VRRSLRRLLSAQHATDDSLIVEELGLMQGLTRVDVAVVNGQLSGYEIKSASDTLERLDRQQASYSAILDRAWLVTAPQHVAAASKQVPTWWGMLAATQTSGATVELSVLRPADQNPSQSAFAIAQLLWRDEVIQLLRARNPKARVASKPRPLLWAMLADVYPLLELKDAVRATLKARQHWRVADTRT